MDRVVEQYVLLYAHLLSEPHRRPRGEEQCNGDDQEQGRKGQHEEAAADNVKGTLGDALPKG